MSAGPAVSPKKAAVPARSGSRPDVASPQRVRPARVRPPTQAEIAAQKEADKKAQELRRKSLQDEGRALRQEHEVLTEQVVRISEPGGGAERVQKLQEQCDQLEMEVASAQERLEKADRQYHEVVAQNSQKQALMKSKCEALQKEVVSSRTACAQQEDRAEDLFTSAADMRELLKRGSEELQQLRNELWERQGEKCLLVGDQASAARLGAEQRVQAVAAEAQVTQLAQALDCEDSRLSQERRKLRRAESSQVQRAAGEKREMVLAENAYPERIQQEREETARCKLVAEEKRVEMREAQEVLAKTRATQKQFAAQVRGKAAEAWRAETARDAARTTRESLEAETSRIHSETKVLQENIARLADQNKKLMSSQVKTRNDCAALVQDKIRRDVKDFLKANPDMSSSRNKMDTERDDQAARLGLAGFATNIPRAGVVGPQRQSN